MAVLRAVGINVADLAQATRFFQGALGFVPHGDAQTVTWPFADGQRAERQILHLGEQILELTQCDKAGRALPEDSTSSDLWFQHIAIVVTDMKAAYARLLGYGITPISEDGPEILPPEAGGVWAYKFLDPDGHPLELLQFPAQTMPAYWRQKPAIDLHLGYDHSAISVADIDRSVAFYRLKLGFDCIARQTNSGVAQERLDAAAHVVVDVVALQSPGAHPPHIELLGYRHPHPRSLPCPFAFNDIGATRLIFGGVPGPLFAEHDPDGHLIVFDDNI